MTTKKQVKRMVKQGWNDEEIAYKLRIDEKEVFNIRKQSNLLTDKEKYDITKSRRRLLIGGAGIIALAAAGGTAYIFREPIAEVKENILNHGLIQERQQTLDQLLKTYPSPYMEKVVYDHNGSLIKKSPQRFAKIMINDPNLRNMVIDAMMPELLKMGYNKQTVEKIFQLPEMLEALEEKIRKGFDQGIDPYVAKDPAATATSMFMFGKGLKSQVYVFQKAFETEKRKIREKEVEIPISEKLKVVLVHERRHTQQYSQGIKLGNGIMVNNSTFRQLSPKMQLFLLETDAYIDCYEFFREKEPGTMAQLFAAGKMTGHMMGAVRSLEGEPASQLENSIVKYQIERHNSYEPEMQVLFDKYGR